MKFFARRVFFPIALLSAVFVALVCGQFEEEHAEKIQALKGYVRDGLVSFDSSTYQKFVLDTPRPYHLFLLFTASDPKFNCDMCLKTSPEFTILAESYEAARRSGYEMDGGKEIFFGLVDFSQNQKAFSIHDFTSAPHLVYLPMDINALNHEDIKKMIFPEPNIFSPYQSGFTAEAMVRFLKEKTGFEFSIQRSMLFLYFILLVALAVVAVMAYVVISNFEFFLSTIRTKKLWMLISLMFYGLSVSGMVYCIIRNPPPYNQHGSKIQYFHPAGRQQFVFEGLIVGFWDVMSAVFVILMVEWALYLKDPTRRSIAVVICATGFIYMYRSMIGAYTFKNQWYQNRPFF